MEQKDLADKSHWDKVYHQATMRIEPGWKPVSYDSLCIEHILLTEIDRYRPETILEVGCGNSTWLPYLARKRNLKVAGMDYSEEGCELARGRLIAEDVSGDIYCKDLFKTGTDEVGQYDFVYSLGVVEHFLNLEDSLSHLIQFVKPGGVLLTEVPNLYSIHGILSWVYQPRQLAKHEIVKKNKLEQAYNKLAFSNIHASYVGLFTLNIVAWGIEQRFPTVDRFVLPVVRNMIWIFDEIIRRIRTFKGISWFSPFLYVVGTRSL